MTDLIQIHFEEFHRKNPEVYRLWDRFTRRMIARGFRHGSASLITERIRWETSVETDGEPVKINNNYRSKYSRLWERNNPQHAGFFRKRELQPRSVNSMNVDDLI